MRGEDKLINDIMSITCLDPNHNNDLFYKMAAQHPKIIVIFNKLTPMTDQSDDLVTYFAIRQFGGI